MLEGAAATAYKCYTVTLEGAVRRRAILASLLFLPATAWERGKLPVMASFSVLADMARQIGGETVAVTALVPPDSDTHEYQPRPSDLAALHDARLVLSNGLGLDRWMERMCDAACGGAIRVVASAEVKPIVRAGGGGGGAGAADPHAWQDPRNGILYARAIAAGMAVAAPDQAATLRDRSERYQAAIAETDGWIERTLAAIPPERRKLITSHDAFGYYAARYRIEMHAVQGIDTEAEPSARGVASLVAQARRQRIRAVFLENMTDPRLARTLAREAGIALGGTVYSDALSSPGGPAATYLAMLRHNTTLFAQAMLAN